MTALGRFADSVTNRPAVDEWLLRRVAQGWTPEAIIAASGRSISRTTAYRWVREFVRTEEVTVGGFTATFVIRRNRPPARISQWRAE